MQFCSECGEISTFGTFCGVCGTAVTTAQPAQNDIMTPTCTEYDRRYGSSSEVALRDLNDLERALIQSKSEAAAEGSRKRKEDAQFQKAICLSLSELPSAAPIRTRTGAGAGEGAVAGVGAGAGAGSSRAGVRTEARRREGGKGSGLGQLFQDINDRLEVLTGIDLDGDGCIGAAKSERTTPPHVIHSEAHQQVDVFMFVSRSSGGNLGCVIARNT